MFVLALSLYNTWNRGVFLLCKITNLLIYSKTIDSLEGRKKMSNAEKFEAFKQKQIQENEEKYGTEIREKYGEDSVRESNAKMMKMTEEEYKKFQNAEALIKEKLQEAVRSHADPSGEIGEEITELHKNWISMTWGQYRPEAHKGLAEMYVKLKMNVFWNIMMKKCQDVQSF